MFYNHASFILTMFGIVIGLTECYLEISCQAGYEKIFWIGSRLTFVIGGFIIGRVIENLSTRAIEIMERIRHKVEGTFSSYHLTISTGIILLERDRDLKDLLIKADQTLYKAKEQKNAIIAVTDL